MDSTDICFTKPADLELPPDAKDGGEVEMLATFKIEGDKMYLEAVEGVPVGDEPDANDKPTDDAPQSADDNKSFEDAVG
jgi:hypothetical protein